MIVAIVIIAATFLAVVGMLLAYWPKGISVGENVPSRPQYLNDSAGEKLDHNIKTSDFVDGYKHRKNAKKK